MNESDTLFEVSCSCDSFYDCEKCIHKSAIVENLRNPVRVVGIAVLTVDSRYGMQKYRCWEGLKIQPKPKMMLSYGMCFRGTRCHPLFLRRQWFLRILKNRD